MTVYTPLFTPSLREHHNAVQRLAEVPGFGIDSAQQIIAEVGPAAATFPSPGQLASWVGTCPGREESAEVSKNNRSPKGNRTMRRVLNQVANAAVKSKGSVFQNLYRRLLLRLGHNKAIWAVVSGGGRWGHYGGTSGGHAANPRWQRVDHAEAKLVSERAITSSSVLSGRRNHKEERKNHDDDEREPRLRCDESR
jgi:hypothetical protein